MDSIATVKDNYFLSPLKRIFEIISTEPFYRRFGLLCEHLRISHTVSGGLSDYETQAKHVKFIVSKIKEKEERGSKEQLPQNEIALYTIVAETIGLQNIDSFPIIYRQLQFLIRFLRILKFPGEIEKVAKSTTVKNSMDLNQLTLAVLKLQYNAQVGLPTF